MNILFCVLCFVVFSWVKINTNHQWSLLISMKMESAEWKWESSCPVRSSLARPFSCLIPCTIEYCHPESRILWAALQSSLWTKKTTSKKAKTISHFHTDNHGIWWMDSSERCSVGEVSELQRHPICISPQSLRWACATCLLFLPCHFSFWKFWPIHGISSAFCLDVYLPMKTTLW